MSCFNDIMILLKISEELKHSHWAELVNINMYQHILLFVPLWEGFIIRDKHTWSTEHSCVFLYVA